MATLVDTLGKKAPGDLILSKQWNDLVAAIDALDARVTSQITNLTTDLNNTKAQVLNVTNDLNGLKTNVSTFEALFKDYYRVLLSTVKGSYALGEIAQIKARLTDLAGNAVNIPDAKNAPWIDFVATWGRLKPADGFVTLGGSGDHALSVQVNAKGEAAVIISPEHAEDITPEVEKQAHATVTAAIPTLNKSIADVILTANSPGEAKAAGAFQRITAEYDRQGVSSVRNYLDTYYLRNTAISPSKIKPLPGHLDFQGTWRDYRSTVMAFAKKDSSSNTPDPGLGASTVQVMFRDWIGPWISLGYLDERAPLVKDTRDRMAAKVTNDYSKSVDLIKKEVGSMMTDRGVIGNQRDSLVIHEAMDQLQVNVPLTYQLPELSKAIQQAVGFQQTLLAAQTTGFAFPAANAFDVIADASTKSDSRVNDLRLQVKTAGDTVTTMQATIATLNGQVKLAQAAINPLSSRVDTVSTQVQRLNDLDPKDIRDRLAEVQGLRLSVNNLNAVIKK